MAEAEGPGFFGTLGNALMKSHAFGDPVETFRRNTPAGLLDDFTPEQQREIGEQLQSQFRTPGRRSSVRQRHLADVESLYAQKQREQVMGALPNLVQGNELTPQQARVIQAMPAGEAYEVVSGLLKPANVGAGTQRFVGANPIAYTPTTDAQNAPRERAKAEAERTRLDQRLDAWADSNPNLTDQQRTAFKNLPVEQKQELVTDRSSVGAGSAQFDAFGNRTAANPTSDIQEWEYGQRNPEYAKDKDAASGGPTADMRNREHRIQTRMDVYNIGREEATKMELNDYQLGQNPNTSRWSVIDMADRSADPVSGSERNINVEGTPSVKEGVDVEATTGVAGGLRRMLNTVADAAGMGTPAELTSEARTELNNFNQVFKLRFADFATEGRRSNMIIDMLDSLTANPSHFLQGSEDARRKLEAIDRLLDQTVTDQTRHVLENPHDFSPREVRDAEKTARGLNGLREDVSVLLEGMGRAGVAPPDTPAPEGLDPDVWKEMTPEERALWQN